MKKLIALTAIAGFLVVGCSTNKNRGGTSDETNPNNTPNMNQNAQPGGTGSSNTSTNSQ
jgi:hypothetical protein